MTDKATSLCEAMRDHVRQLRDWWANGGGVSIDLVAADNLEEAADLIEQQAATIEALRKELRWLSLFADVRSKDDSKTFARVNRGALRTIRDRAALKLTDQGE